MIPVGLRLRRTVSHPLSQTAQYEGGDYTVEQFQTQLQKQKSEESKSSKSAMLGKRSKVHTYSTLQHNLR